MKSFNTKLNDLIFTTTGQMDITKIVILSFVHDSQTPIQIQ